jgi:hypothetical protein
LAYRDDCYHSSSLHAYTVFTEEILAEDIATFMIAVIVGQIIRAINSSKKTSPLREQK